MKVYTQSELDRMPRSQLIVLIQELESELEECMMLLHDASEALDKS